MKTSFEAVRLPSGDEPIAPVTILDAQDRVVRIVSADDFRRSRLAATTNTLGDRRAVVSLRTKRAARRARRESRLVSAASGGPRYGLCVSRETSRRLGNVEAARAISTATDRGRG